MRHSERPCLQAARRLYSRATEETAGPPLGEDQMVLCPTCGRPGSERFVANLNVQPCAVMFHYRADRAEETWEAFKRLASRQVQGTFSAAEEALYAELVASEKPSVATSANG